MLFYLVFSLPACTFTHKWFTSVLCNLVIMRRALCPLPDYFKRTMRSFICISFKEKRWFLRFFGYANFACKWVPKHLGNIKHLKMCVTFYDHTQFCFISCDGWSLVFFERLAALDRFDSDPKKKLVQWDHHMSQCQDSPCLHLLSWCNYRYSFFSSLNGALLDDRLCVHPGNEARPRNQ